MFDTNRGWCAALPALSRVFPSSRVICCVRNVAWVLDSFERQVQKSGLQTPRIFWFEGSPEKTEGFSNVFERVETLMRKQVGSSLHGLRQARFSEYASMLLVVRYESLTTDPSATMSRLYDFWGRTLTRTRTISKISTFHSRPCWTPGWVCRTCTKSVRGSTLQHARLFFLPRFLCNTTEISGIRRDRTHGA